MSRLYEKPRLVQWAKRGKKKWYIFYTDYTGAHPVRKRKLCEALGAFNAELRKERLEDYLSRELMDRAEVLKQGGALAFDSSLRREVEVYRADVEKRGKTRESNPEARQGLSAQSVRAINDSLDHFKAWLEHPGQTSLKTGQLDRRTLGSFFDHLANTPGHRGNIEVARSAATLNHHRRIIRACLRWINSLRPRRFPDFDELSTAFKPVGGSPRVAKAYSPVQLVGFAKAADEIDRGERLTTIERRKATTGKAESFEQRVGQRPVTPILNLFLVLALTGCRRQEALNIKWADVDFERRGILIMAPKTGRERFIPISGAAEGEVAPQFLKLMKVWKDSSSHDYVLPHGDLEAPAFAKSAWAEACRRAKVQLSPQRLRQNFTSYGASMGVPATTCALWQGHSSLIAERHYRALVPGRNKAANFEDAMGLTTVVRELILELKGRKVTHA